MNGTKKKNPESPSFSPMNGTKKRIPRILPYERYKKKNPESPSFFPLKKERMEVSIERFAY